MRQHQRELTTAEVDVLVVTFEMPERARKYADESELPWPLLIDTDRSLYRAFGMDRADSWTVFGPRSWIGYIALLLRGRRLKKPTGDVHQLGGDVLIDPKGIVRYHYVGDGPIDRPSVGQLLARVVDCQS